MPAAAIDVSFCGAATTASTSPASAARTARLALASDARPNAAPFWPNTKSLISGIGTSSTASPGAVASLGSRIGTSLAVMFAACAWRAITLASPTTIGRQMACTAGSSAAFRLISGPMPAGSPVAMATRVATFDISRSATFDHRPTDISHSGERVKLLALVTAALMLPAAAPVAAAQDWPARPVRIIAPFAPGGTADTLGRVAAEHLSEALQQQFFVENRAGAGGVTASLAVARMDPDGYNFVVSGIATHAIAPIINPNTGYDPVKDFTHVAYFGGPPIVLIVPTGLGVKSLQRSRQLREDAQRDVDVRIAWDRYQRAPRCGILRPEGRNCDRAHSLPWGGARRTGRGCRTSSLRLDDLDDGRRSDRGRHRGPACGQCAGRGLPTSLLFRPSRKQATPTW